MAPLRDVPAAILLGGLGTRLRSVVSDRPKALAQVAGRPFVSYLFDQLMRAGVRRAILCAGYLGAQVQAQFGEAYHTLSLAYSVETEPLGTAGALRLAAPLVASPTCLVLNGDSYCEADFNAFWQWHGQHGALASLVLTRVIDTGRYGQVRVQPNGSVLRFVEKQARGGPGWINAGVYLIDQTVLNTIPAGRAVSLEHEIFPAQVGQGLYGWQGGERFLDIGTPTAYEVAQTFFGGP